MLELCEVRVPGPAGLRAVIVQTDGISHEVRSQVSSGHYRPRMTELQLKRDLPFLCQAQLP